MLTLHEIPKEITPINERTLHFILSWQELYRNRFPLRISRENIEYRESGGEWVRLSSNDVTSWIRDSTLSPEQIDFDHVIWSMVTMI